MRFEILRLCLWYFCENFCDFQAKYIAQCMEDIKQELRQDNLPVKSNAVAKLTYVNQKKKNEKYFFTNEIFFSCKCWGTISHGRASILLR